MEELNELYRQALEAYAPYPRPLPQEQLVELLREVQEIYGCIPKDAQQEIGRLFEIKETVIGRLIRLYPSLKEAPWRHRITICLGARCGAKDSQAVLEEARRLLGISVNQATDDGRFFLTIQNCMKSCKTGPNMRIDGEDYQQVKPEELGSIFQKYK